MIHDVLARAPSRFRLRMDRVGAYTALMIESDADPVGECFGFLEVQSFAVGRKIAREDGSGWIGQVAFGLYAVLMVNGDDWRSWSRRVGAAPARR